ncbi:hypothetical protein IF2G_09913 [Cordyceps javanica]|nr:hypothetical protein IF2G_09913 [Cordyceps javanica]
MVMIIIYVVIKRNAILVEQGASPVCAFRCVRHEMFLEAGKKEKGQIIGHSSTLPP